MRKNTGCGNGHKHCPPLPANDKVKSKSLFTASEQFAPPNTEEATAILGDVFIQTLTEADIYLPTYARAVKNIEKNVSLTQCKAIPVVGNPTSAKILIDGIVHNNIQYVEDAYGVVKDYSVDVPFSAFDQIDLADDVDDPFGINFSIKDNILQRRELADNGMAADRCEFGSVTFEINNEPIRCKLLASLVNELDLLKHFDNWGRFNKITEKLDINLVIKLTQKQQIWPTPANGNNCTSDSADGSSASDAQTPANNWESVYSKFRRMTGY
ncbi:CsxC family protein [Virgibacillus ihumii]|uniref:CsxC family protein n=1 Tax=Virgibacillus ihumii TaxID=2686091 RepID=UPI00157CE766|nr:hypothetical protein [Virgibacillus ihumii]